MARGVQGGLHTPESLSGEQGPSPNMLSVAESCFEPLNLKLGALR